jgi:hypothetical protein
LVGQVVDTIAQIRDARVPGERALHGWRSSGIWATLELIKIKNMGNPMNIKRLSIGTVVGAIALYLLGYLIWEVLFKGYFDAQAGPVVGVYRTVPVMWALILANVLYGLLLTYVLERGSGSASIVDGVTAGVIVGLLAWGMSDIIHYAFTNVGTLNSAIADALLEGVHAGISGGIVAAVLGKIGK